MGKSNVGFVLVTLLLVSSMFFPSLQNAYAAPDQISEDDVWDIDNTITNDIQILPGATLEIAHGTTITFDGAGIQLQPGSTLLIDGTITFADDPEEDSQFIFNLGTIHVRCGTEPMPFENYDGLILPPGQVIFPNDCPFDNRILIDGDVFSVESGELAEFEFQKEYLIVNNVYVAGQIDNNGSVDNEGLVSLDYGLIRNTGSWINVCGNFDTRGIFVISDGSTIGEFDKTECALPEAQDDVYSGNEDEELVIAAPGVLSNDSDPDTDDTLLTVTLNGTLPTNGVVVLAPDGGFRYNPSPNFAGTDTFSYELDDGTGGLAAGKVTILVSSSNDSPTANPDNVTVSEDDGDVDITSSVLNNDTDPDFPDDELSIISANDPPTTDGQVTLGSLYYNPNGQFEYLPEGDTATDIFNYIISDTVGLKSSSTVTVTITGQNDAPTAVADISYEMGQATQLAVAAPGLLENDFDVDGTLNVKADIRVQPPPSTGTVQINSDGSFIFTSNSEFVGTATFSYEITDTGGLKGIGDVSITINDTIVPIITVIPLDVNIIQDSPSPVLLDGVSTDDGSPITVTGSVDTTILGDVVISYDSTDGINNADTAFRTYHVIDITAPSVPIIDSPADGTTTSNPLQTVSGTAEPDSTIEVFVNSASVGTTTADSAGDWTLPIILVEGTNVITSTATDTSNNTSSPSTPITITLDTIAPDAPIVSSPADGTTTSNPLQTVSGTAEPDSTIEVFLNSASVGTTTTDSAGDWTLPIILVEGTNVITSTATDDIHTSPESTPITVTLDTIAPDAPIVSSPADGTTTSNPLQTVSGTAEPDSTIEVFVNSASVGTTTADSAGDWTLPITLVEGTNVITSTATDTSNNTSSPSTPITVTLDTIAPDAPIVSSPADGTTTSNLLQTVSGTAEPDSTIEVFLNSASVGTTTTDSAGDWTLPITLVEGTNVITSTATDDIHTSPSSTPITVTLDTTAPPSAPIIDSPADGTTTSNPLQTVSGTAEPDSTIEVFVNSASVGTTTADSAGDWTLPIILVEGTNVITSTATNENGITSDESTPITVTLLDPLLQQKLVLIEELENLIDDAEDKKTEKELEKALKHFRKGADTKHYTEDENSFLDSKSAEKVLKEDQKGIKHLLKIIEKQHESGSFNIELGKFIIHYLKIDKQLIVNTHLNDHSHERKSLDDFTKSLKPIGVETDPEFIDDGLSKYDDNMIENFGKSWKDIAKEKRDSDNEKLDKKKLSWKQYVEKLKSEGKWDKKSNKDDKKDTRK